ncbi:MAG: NADH-quinone oxidoreductase subunit NuoB [Acidobacteria bacterium]|nr:NADH-quinone oxidoreductase subunit NuoB [Acidobacteriota bacterium]
MFKILSKSASTGVVTTRYPETAARVSPLFRGAPKIKFARWSDARPAAEACPTEAISLCDAGSEREVTLDYGLCTFCGYCAEADLSGAITMTNEFALAVRARQDLTLIARYGLNGDGTHQELQSVEQGSVVHEPGQTEAAIQRVAKVLGRSLAIREVDAGSCNGCELEIGALNNPIYDLERLGIHFAASPRHADMLLVTGPVTRNMELALLKTYNATPDPKVVVAVGACGISGGIYGKSYAITGSVGEVVPVDVFVPGCPPRPEALLQGILIAVGRLEQRFLGLRFNNEGFAS